MANLTVGFTLGLICLAVFVFVMLRLWWLTRAGDYRLRGLSEKEDREFRMVRGVFLVSLVMACVAVWLLQRG